MCNYAADIDEAVYLTDIDAVREDSLSFGGIFGVKSETRDKPGSVVIGSNVPGVFAVGHLKDITVHISNITRNELGSF